MKQSFAFGEPGRLKFHSCRSRQLWTKIQKTKQKLSKLRLISVWTKKTRKRYQNLLYRLQRYVRQLILSSIGTTSIVAVVTNSLSAQAIGPEFLVNTYTPGNQQRASIAMDHLGNFVVVWESLIQDGVNPPNVGSNGVYGQLFQANGTAIGGEFQINTYTIDRQGNPSVAMDDDGDFVVVWESYQQGDVMNSMDIYGQRFQANGTKVGSEFRINSHTPDLQRKPQVAMDSDGDFVVVWESYQQNGSTTDFDIYGQRFSAGGNPVGSEFLVNTRILDRQLNPDLDMDAAGNFIVVWQDDREASFVFDVYAQRFAANGTKIGSEFIPTTVQQGSQGSPDVAMDSDGDFAIIWQSNGQQTGYRVYGQQFQSSGNALGNEFAISEFISQNHFSGGAAIAMDADGDFSVAWTDGNQDGDLLGIFGRCFNANGSPNGNEFQINTTTEDLQLGTAIAMDEDGDFTVAWQSYRIEGPDTSAVLFWPRYGIAAQRFQSKFGNDCLNTPLDLTGMVSGMVEHKTQITISSNQQITSGAQVLYSAPQSTTLEQGFEVQSGAVFEVSTENCAND